MEDTRCTFCNTKLNGEDGRAPRMDGKAARCPTCLTIVDEGFTFTEVVYKDGKLVMMTSRLDTLATTSITV